MASWLAEWWYGSVDQNLEKGDVDTAFWLLGHGTLDEHLESLKKMVCTCSTEVIEKLLTWNLTRNVDFFSVTVLSGICERDRLLEDCGDAALAALMIRAFSALAKKDGTMEARLELLGRLCGMHLPSDSIAATAGAEQVVGNALQLALDAHGVPPVTMSNALRINEECWYSANGVAGAANGEKVTVVSIVDQNVSVRRPNGQAMSTIVTRLQPCVTAAIINEQQRQLAFSRSARLIGAQTSS